MKKKKIEFIKDPDFWIGFASGIVANLVGAYLYEKIKEKKENAKVVQKLR